MISQALLVAFVVFLSTLQSVSAASPGAWDASCSAASSIRYSSPHQYPKFSISANFSDPSCVPGGRCTLVFGITSTYYRMSVPDINDVAVFVDDSHGSSLGQFSIPPYTANEGLKTGCGGSLVTAKDKQVNMQAPFLVHWEVPDRAKSSDWIIKGGVSFDGMEQVLQPVLVEFEHYKEVAGMDHVDGDAGMSHTSLEEATEAQATAGSQPTNSVAPTGSEAGEETLTYTAGDKPASTPDTNAEEEENLVFTAHGGNQGDATLPNLEPEAFKADIEDTQESLPMGVIIALSIGIPGIAAIAMLVGRNVMAN